MTVTVQHHDDVAVIAMDNPPVNALGIALRQGLMAALDELRGKAGLKAIVLAGTERAFSGGADITEFGKPPKEPNLRAVIAAVEDMPVPVVAAIHGVALGGGLELALGCHARVAWASARLGLPEVKLGILPGAGGTQRLPRIVGVEKALSMIVSGNPVSGKEAAELGLVDALMDGAYPDAGITFAQSLTERRRVRDRDEKLAPAREDPGLIDRVAGPLLRGVGPQAPRACVASVRAAVERPFDEGLAEERRLFSELVASDESKAQRYAFFAEREAQKAKLPPGTVARQIRRAAVIGAGTMGGGIAMSFANAGIPVTVLETAQDALDRGLGRVSELYQGSAKRGSITQDQASERRGLIGGTLDYDALADADIVIEAVFEEMSVKKSVFETLDRVAKPGAVLASNTSYLDIDEIAAATARPGDVLGMHFFSPANVMRLLEIVRGRETSPEVIATAAEIGKRLGKVAVVVGNCFGFVGNRMLSKRTDAAERLLLEGASPQEVDQALTDFGFRMGPFAMADLAGLDIGMRIRRAFGKVAPVADAITAEGRYGQKTGKGYYRYEGRNAAPDPEVEAIIEREASKLGINRRKISQEEILERLVFPMINEGAKILEEGIAERPGDIDTIWQYGYNWPVWRGGPMFYGDSVGLRRVRDRLVEDGLEPAPLLSRLAEEGRGFANARG